MLLKPSQDQREELFHLRRRLIELRRIATPQRDILARGGDVLGRLPGLEADDARDWFRDVYDHLVRISELIDSYRDLLSGALDLYLSTVSNRLNAISKQLTVVATIFLPLTFVTGFFGQNFGSLVRHINTAVGLLGLRRGRHAAVGRGPALVLPPPGLPRRRLNATARVRRSAVISRPAREPNTDFQRVFPKHGR